MQSGNVGGERRSSRRSVARWVVAALFFALPWALVVAALYLSFTFPLKQDRYGHAFRSHLWNRAAAYLQLLRSPQKLANKELPLERIHEMIDAAAARHGVERCLVHAVVAYESAYWPNAISTTGAMGLMAVKPETAVALRLRDPFDPAETSTACAIYAISSRLWAGTSSARWPPTTPPGVGTRVVGRSSVSRDPGLRRTRGPATALRKGNGGLVRR